MTVTLVHSNPIALENGLLRVDRKFHLGMLRYAARLEQPVLSINPAARSGQPIMDPVQLPLRDLPYEVMAIDTGPQGLPLASERPRLQAQLARSSVVYGGELGVAELCRHLRVPYILILEYDLATQIAATTLQVAGRARRLARSARCTWRHFTAEIPRIRAAHAVHCNGFPVHESSQRYNANCLLYLDSRMSRELLIAPERLRARLADSAHRPLRLLYSGRYEPFKGALDVLRVAQSCIERGLDVELHCYGQGTLGEPMRRIAASRPDRLQVHEAIPYPQLVELSRGFDLFICCHVQNDPSCTYLEAMGAGLPIVGYDNAMWRSMCRVSRAGSCSPLGRPHAVAASIETLCRDRSLLADMSERALRFARCHLFEAEFDRRIEAVGAVAGRGTRAAAAAAAPVTAP